MDFVMSCLSVGENGNLSIGGCDVAALAEEYGPPAYILDEDQIRENWNWEKTARKRFQTRSSYTTEPINALPKDRIYYIKTDIITSLKRRAAPGLCTRLQFQEARP